MTRTDPTTDIGTETGPAHQGAVLLCERCGYEIDGLAWEATCPECGAGVRESDPAKRTGTPWQRRPGVGAYLATLWACARSPGRVLATLDPSTGAAGLMRAHAWVVAGLVMLPWAVALAPDFVRGRTNAWPPAIPQPFGDRVAIVTLLIAWPALAGIAVILLSHMEARGLRILAWQRGWRFGPRLALAVVAHGGTGWVVAAIFAGPGSAMAFAAWDRRWSFEVLGQWVNAPVAFSVIAFGGAVLGFLSFETFAWFGLRKCRFANTPRR